MEQFDGRRYMAKLSACSFSFTKKNFYIGLTRFLFFDKIQLYYYA